LFGAGYVSASWPEALDFESRKNVSSQTQLNWHTKLVYDRQCDLLSGFFSHYGFSEFSGFGE